jgi:hypothetical protein
LYIVRRSRSIFNNIHMSVLLIYKMFNTFINVSPQFICIAWIHFYIFNFCKRNPMEFNIKITSLNVFLSNEFSIEWYLFFVREFNYAIKANLMARFIFPWEEYFSNTMNKILLIHLLLRYKNIHT